MAKSKQEARAEIVAVSDDASAERGEEIEWLKAGVWVAIVCADPIYHGLLAAVTPTHYYLKQASWVLDTGILSDFIDDPKKTANHVAYVGDIAIERPVVGAYRLRSTGGLDSK